MTRMAEAPPSELPSYAGWKVAFVLELKRQGIPVGLRERDLRELFIKGRTPEQAVNRAQAYYWNSRPAFVRIGRKAMTEDLPFKVVRSNGTDEVLARAMNLLVARAAYREAARQYPEDFIELRQGARVIEKSK
jgi:hypothetical protein